MIEGSARAADLAASGANVLVVADATAGLKALIDKSAAGFVGSSLDYVVAASKDPAIADAGIGWTRNINTYSSGMAYAWGVKPGNDGLIDALIRGSCGLADKAIASAYANAFLALTRRSSRHRGRPLSAPA